MYRRIVVDDSIGRESREVLQLQALKNYELSSWYYWYGGMRVLCSATLANHFIMSKKCFIMSSRKRFQIQTLLTRRLLVLVADY